MAQLSMRIDDELRDKFAKLAEENGMSQPQMFAQLMAQAETDELKAMVPEIATEIDAVRTHLNSVMDAYTMAVKRSTEAYEIAADKVRGQLGLLAAAMEENKQLKALKAENERLEQELAEAQAKAAEADALRKQLTEAREQYLKLSELRTTEMAQHAEEMADLRDRHADELKKARSDGFQQLLALVTAQQSKPSGASK